MPRGANEADWLAWYGIVNCIYKKWNIHSTCDNPSTEPIILSCGLNVKTAFVNVENMTQKHVKMVLAERKRFSLKDIDCKYKIKHQLIQSFISDKNGRLYILKVPYGLQSMCKQTCKHLVRSTLYILMYLLIFSQSNS